MSTKEKTYKFPIYSASIAAGSILLAVGIIIIISRR
jgi:hypothetical protein